VNDDYLIKLDGLKMTLEDSGVLKTLVKNSELVLPPNKSVGLVGESGSGKSLTVSSIMGLFPFLPGVSGGKLCINFNSNKADIWNDAPYLNGKTYNRKSYFRWQKKISRRMRPYRGRNISIIFQKAKASLNPFLKIKSQIFESLQMAGERKSDERAIEWLVNCGFSSIEAREVAEQYPHQLSGGQAQRAVMAVTLSSQAETVIADEPTTGLDAKLQVETLVFMKKLLDRYKRSAIIISHNLQSLAKFTDNCYVMYKGLTVESGPTPKILRESGNNHPYTKKLQGEVEYGGEVGQILSAEISGCPYYSNCELYRKMAENQKGRCREIEPPRTAISSDHYIRCWAFES
jgi:ABC-type dipeptide/oligopeptide/nickel transport system ATPase component